MFSKGFSVKMRPISRRNDSPKAWLPQIASGEQQSAPLDIFAQGLPLAVGEVEGVAAVHENDRVVEQGGILDADQLGMRFDANVQLVAGLFHEVCQARGAASQPPGCRSLATANLPRTILSVLPACHDSRESRPSGNSRLVA